MSDEKGWDEMRRAKEEMFFDEQNKRALGKIKDRTKKRLSPISGQPMEELVYQGVVIDRCPTSGGIWLDPGELEQIIKAATEEKKQGEDWLGNFFGFITKSR